MSHSHPQWHQQQQQQQQQAEEEFPISKHQKMLSSRMACSRNVDLYHTRLLLPNPGMSRRNSAQTRNAARFMSTSLPRYGLGGHNWKRFSPDAYRELIHYALSPSPSTSGSSPMASVSYLEVAGQEGGEIAMVGAVQRAIERSPELAENPLTITCRIGYRSLEPEEAELPGDVAMASEGGEQEQQSGKIVHSLTRQSILQAVESSPLLELMQDIDKLKLVFLVQNPEVQVLELLKDSPKATLEERQAFIQDRWTPAFEALQEYATEPTATGGAISFGIVSNGLGIPAEQQAGLRHPLHLDPESVIQAAQTYDRFSTIQLPANLLETHGWNVARKLHSALPNVTLAAMRPLSCYPDLGTGTGHPFKLVDYAMPTLDGVNPYAPVGNDGGTITESQSVQYTNEMTGIPPIYQVALQTTMSHFDADHILEAKQERELTMEERETLDGCKLIQSMIHDLDNDLEHVRSFAAHEDELYNRIIPLLYDTFEAMDDRTSDVLMAYFSAYAVAVRYSIAKNTRRVLKEGEESGGTGVTYPSIPQSMTLQEFALRQMLADHTFDRLVIGAATLEEFKEHNKLIQKISSDPSPLDAIDKANEEEGAKEEK